MRASISAAENSGPPIVAFTGEKLHRADRLGASSPVIRSARWLRKQRQDARPARCCADGDGQLGDRLHARRKLVAQVTQTQAVLGGGG
jgi:hypothetical protein